MERHVVPKVWHMPLRLLSIFLLQNTAYVTFLSHPSLWWFFFSVLKQRRNASWVSPQIQPYMEQLVYKCHTCVCSSTEVRQPSVRLRSLIVSAFVHTHTHTYIYIHHWHRTTFGSRWGYRYAYRWTWIKRYALTIALPHTPMKSHPVYQSGLTVKKKISTQV